MRAAGTRHYYNREAALQLCGKTKDKSMNEILQARTEVQREINVRQNVYPKLVMNGKLSQDEADRRMRALRYALYYLELPQDQQLSTSSTMGGR